MVTSAAEIGPRVRERGAFYNPQRTLGQQSAIITIKLVHSAIFLVNCTAIIHIFMAGVFNRPSRWTRLALMAAGAESAVFVANHGRCPLTDVVEDLGAENGRVSDIFLPRWFADRIPQIFTPPLIVGVLALLFNGWRHHTRESRWF